MIPYWRQYCERPIPGHFHDELLELRANSTRGFLIDPTLGTPNLIGGDPGNTVGADVVGAVIGGGGEKGTPNSILDDYGTVSGGSGNEAGSSDEPANTYATVGGGLNNIASGQHAAIGGGNENAASAELSTIGGGDYNLAEGLLTTVGGGGTSSVVDPALANRAVDSFSTVGGGSNNLAGTVNADLGNAGYAVVAGGAANVANNYSATVVEDCVIQPAATVQLWRVARLTRQAGIAQVWVVVSPTRPAGMERLLPEAFSMWRVAQAPLLLAGVPMRHLLDIAMLLGSRQKRSIPEPIYGLM